MWHHTDPQGGGDTQDPGNYRGIAVGSLLAKLYACILNELLMKWTEQHQLRARGQAGFRRDHRTTDQTFVVRTLIEKAKADRQPLYSCFVDFKKAYDTVCLFVFYRGRPDQGRVREQSPAAQCGISRVNVRAARQIIKVPCSKYVDGGH